MYAKSLGNPYILLICHLFSPILCDFLSCIFINCRRPLLFIALSAAPPPSPCSSPLWFALPFICRFFFDLSLFFSAFHLSYILQSIFYFCWFVYNENFELTLQNDPKKIENIVKKKLWNKCATKKKTTTKTYPINPTKWQNTN